MICKICKQAVLSEQAFYHQCNIEARFKRAALKRAAREMEMTQNERDTLCAKRDKMGAK